MRQRDQVDAHSVGVLTVIMIVSSLIFFFPNLVTGVAGRDAWLVIPAGIPLIALVVLGWLRIYYLPGLTPLDRAARSPVLRIPTGLLLAAFAVYHAGIVLGETVGVMVSIYPETPAVVFHGGLMLAALAPAAYGREVIARTAILLAPVMLLAGLGNLILVIPRNVDVGQLFPILEFGWSRVVAAIPLVAAATSEAVVLTFYADGIRDPNRMNRALPLAAATCILVLTGATALDLAVLGPNETAREVVPTLATMRLVRLAPVLARVESLIFSTWLLGIFIKLALFTYASGLALRQGLGLSDRWHTPFRAATAGLAIAVALILFPDTGRLQYHLLNVWPVVGTAGLLISLALGLVRPHQQGPGEEA